MAFAFAGDGREDDNAGPAGGHDAAILSGAIGDGGDDDIIEAGAIEDGFGDGGEGKPARALDLPDKGVAQRIVSGNDPDSWSAHARSVGGTAPRRDGRSAPPAAAHRT